MTVLVDTWNHERFIERALDSALTQDFDMSQVEVIVVDDGSTDTTPEKIAAYGDRVRYVRKENGGQASAFNIGIPLARGEIVAMLDGDDWWHVGKLRAVVDAFERHPCAYAVGHGIIVTCAKSEDVQQPAAELVLDLHDLESARLYPKHACFMGTSRLAARTTALKKLLPVPEALIVEADEYLFALLPCMAPVVILREALTHYRIHEGNLFQFSAYDDRRMLLKRRVMCCLAELLPRKMAELGVSQACIKEALRHTSLDARRLTLAVDGGLPGSALFPEIAAWRLEHQWTLRRLPAKIVMMILAAMLPARTFYRLRHFYSVRRA